MNYIILTDEFVKQFNGYTQSPYVFEPLQTNTGQWVCDAECIEAFPKIFEGQKFEPIDLTIKDLQPDYDRLDFKVDGTYPVYSKTENYYERWVSIVYLVNGEKKEVITKMDDATVTKDGYAIDLETEIRLKEAAQVIK